MGFRRAAAWQHVVETLRVSDLDHAVETEQRYQTLASWGTPLIVVAGVLLMIWSGLVLSNARDRGVPLERTWTAALWWLIPLFGPPRPINAIATSVEAFDYSDRRLKYWLYMMYVNFPIVLLFELVVASAYVEVVDGRLVDNDLFLEAVNRERSVRPLLTLALIATATLASRAILHADRAISNTDTAGRRRPATQQPPTTPLR